MIHLRSYAKINLSLDVGEVMPNGMHPVDMIMQQTTLYDDVIVNLREGDGVSGAECAAENIAADCTAISIGAGFSVALKTSDADLPTDSGNIAFRAAELMASKYAELMPEKAEQDRKKTICIYIDKRIPVAAGLAGGSGNAAAVIHGLNALWGLGLSLAELCEIGATLGSDVPFCIMGQAVENIYLPHNVRDDALAVTCARARGTGTDLTPSTSLNAQLLIAKPAIGVSTAEVYRGIDNCETKERPNNDILEEAIRKHSIEKTLPEMINVLENYTLSAYPEVAELKDFIQKNIKGALHVLMSGSGPSVFAIFDSKDEISAIEGLKILKRHGYEAYACRAK